jgi:hypothetical protein
MKKGITIIEFVGAVLLLVVIGHLLSNTTNILSIKTNHSLITGVKEAVYSYMGTAKKFCLEESYLLENREDIFFFGNKKIEMKTICNNLSTKMKEVIVEGCLLEFNYCYENKVYVYVE